jgi:hypothetical protein
LLLSSIAKGGRGAKPRSLIATDHLPNRATGIFHEEFGYPPEDPALPSLRSSAIRPRSSSQFKREPTGDAVTNYTPQRFHYLANTRSHLAGRSQSEPTAADAATKLAPGAGLIVALLLSLGLWAAIWLTVSRLAPLWN